MKFILAALLISAVVVSGRLSADYDYDGYDVDFDTMGLEQLTQRYGSAYPGYSGFQQNLGFAQNEPQQNWAQNLNLGFAMPQQQQFSLGSGGLSLGLGQSGSSKKGQTTVAAPIYAESMIVPKIITQPILRPHMVTQPIVQQQLIQQPIVETRQVIQPVIRRIITQPIIRPQILESTTIQPTLKTETTVQPTLIQQTVVTPQLQNLPMENQPIQEAPTTQMQQAVVQPTISKKGGQSGLGQLRGY